MAKVGRPTKLTPELIETLKEVVEDALYFTDQDLVEELNEKLPKDQQIKYTTFKAYKGGQRQDNNPLIKEFVSLIKKALRSEKKALMNDLKKGENQWQSRAWILERKFNEWNLKKIIESDITTKGESLNIDLSKLSYEQLKDLAGDNTKGS
jgi:hypothetical protein